MPISRSMEEAKRCLERAKQRALSLEERKQAAIELAAYILQEAKRIQTPRERNIQAQLAAMMKDPIGKIFVTSMTDQCFRTQDSNRVADQLVYLLDKVGVPQFFAPFKRFQLEAFRWMGRPLAKVLVPLVKRFIRQETSNVILPGEPAKLLHHMHRRRQEGVHINLNHLGEAILGEEEAKRRLKTYLEDLANPEIECISVKVSTIFSQIHLLGWEETLAELEIRLKKLYRASQENCLKLPDGTSVPKFVNLDMEEYRDLHITVELFKRVLDDAEFYQYSAGIVLQSYLPDAFLLQKDLTNWALERVGSGGAPIKIRIVKGANLAMEQVEAAIKDWPQAPYHSKNAVDANYKRMVTYGCLPSHAQAVNLGIASHNVFDIAYALILRAENGVENYICFEMLEGMSDHVRRVVQQLSGNILLYCPAATKEDFQNALAYLVRRLDENTAPENFLCQAFSMTPGSKSWQQQAELFVRACDDMDTVSYHPSRQQNRFKEALKANNNLPFHNEADTDWSLPQNRKWAENIIRTWSTKLFDPLPLVLGDKTVAVGVGLENGIDPSFPDKVLYRYAMAGEDELEIALQNSVKAFEKWSKRPTENRATLLGDVANSLRSHRAALIGAMVADTGKTISEADVEISEAIDFVEYYRRNVQEFLQFNDISLTPKGPTLVAPPWNFPCSIPVGGIAAALTAGNSVIFKPAPEAVLVGYELAKAFWEAGVDKDVLQFLCCPDDPIGTRLIQDPRIAVVILTGATVTAKLFMRLRPGLDLMAETGGKNAMIITRMSDRDLAIKDVIHSAFGHAGQKCSACSLLILEKEVYDDLHFRRQLRDAAASLCVGVPWQLDTRLNPLIREPSPSLLQGLTSLEEGETWLLKPRQDTHNTNLWSPGIKLGVKPGSFMHQTELFGPVLGVMCAKDLDEAIEMANGTPYGLTSGIHSLDEREQHHWLNHIVAGNCYINRSITGAIVQRQPFGGCKESSFGPGIKAGGPNYVLQLMHVEQVDLPSEREPVSDVVNLMSQKVHKSCNDRSDIDLWNASVGSYAFFWNHYFSKMHDPSQVRGQDNLLFYKPHHTCTLRVQENDQRFGVMRALAAALTCQATVEISVPPGQAKSLAKDEWFIQAEGLTLCEETEELFHKRLVAGEIRRLRLLSAPSLALQQACAHSACNLIVQPVVANGRIELLRWLREVSVSFDSHRYGYLGEFESIESAISPPAKEGAKACTNCSCRM